MKYIDNDCIAIENRLFCLSVGTDGIARSLIFKATGEEMLETGEEIALFSATQKRPYHNEVKLAHPNKRTTFQADRLRIEKDALIVGFETVPYEAVVDVSERDEYITFTLKDFITHKEVYGGLIITLPPVDEFRVLQLPIRKRERFGEWLNVVRGGGVAVSVLATSPYPRIDAEKRKNSRILYADCRKEVKLKGVGAALAVNTEDKLLDSIDCIERDFKLPRGVESRRREEINASIYWTANITPDNVDEHIAYAKAGGFRMMMVYEPPLTGKGGYGLCGSYELLPIYADGGLKMIVDRIKSAGIIPGLHFLQTFIGKNTSYVTPHADPRLGLVRHFTLTRALPAEGAETVFVNENPEGSTMADGTRILKFGGELISYESYSDERPYRFEGCRRGEWNTAPVAHPAGEIGGLLDVCEYGAASCYIDQRTDLQDEVAEKIARIYDLGFEFIYFDGSEGTNPPFEYNVPNAQYRVLKKLGSQPRFTMGAAKAHFGWHFMSGGNAFDVFPPEIFKAMIDKYPAEEVGRVSSDYTVVNFGWWGFWDPKPEKGSLGIQPDLYEYGTSRAAAWDCPVTVMENLEAMRNHPRTADILEVIRRWEDVRAKKWLTPSQKLMLRELGPEHEHILLINETGQYELVPYHQVKDAAGGREDAVRAFVFERNGSSYAVYWHPTGEGRLSLTILSGQLTLLEELNSAPLPVEDCDGNAVVPVGRRRYIKVQMPVSQLARILEEGCVL